MSDTTHMLKEMLTIAKRLVRQAGEMQQDGVFIADAETLAKLTIKLDDELCGGADLPRMWHDVQIAKVLT